MIPKAVRWWSERSAAERQARRWARSADHYRKICKWDYWVAGAEARATDRGRQVLGHRLHRDKFRPFDSGDAVLEGLSDVDEHHLLAAIETPLDIFYTNFHLRDYS